MAVHHPLHFHDIHKPHRTRHRRVRHPRHAAHAAHASHAQIHTLPRARIYQGEHRAGTYWTGH